MEVLLKKLVVYWLSVRSFFQENDTNWFFKIFRLPFFLSISGILHRYHSWVHVGRALTLLLRFSYCLKSFSWSCLSHPPHKVCCCLCLLGGKFKEQLILNEGSGRLNLSIAVDSFVGNQPRQPFCFRARAHQLSEGFLASLLARPPPAGGRARKPSDSWCARALKQNGCLGWSPTKLSTDLINDSWSNYD